MQDEQTVQVISVLYDGYVRWLREVCHVRGGEPTFAQVLSYEEYRALFWQRVEEKQSTEVRN